jgi:hypothetical protein
MAGCDRKKQHSEGEDSSQVQGIPIGDWVGLIDDHASNHWTKGVGHIKVRGI